MVPIWKQWLRIARLPAGQTLARLPLPRLQTPFSMSAYLLREFAVSFRASARCRLGSCALLALALMVLTVLPLQAQSASGVVEGRVFNAATGNALVNARVTLEGANRTVITDEGGSFRFTGVPAGEAR